MRTAKSWEIPRSTKRPIGSGAFGTVHNISGNRGILKKPKKNRPKGDPAYMAFVKYVLSTKNSNPFLPRIEKVYKTDEGGFAIRMEKLKDYHALSWEELDEIPTRYGFETTRPDDEGDDSIEAMIKTLFYDPKSIDTPLGHAINRDLYRVIVAVHAIARKGQFNIDIHRGNYMFRQMDGGRHQLVITDPLSVGPARYAPTQQEEPKKFVNR